MKTVCTTNVTEVLSDKVAITTEKYTTLTS
jgi:hypothetical protein